MAARKGGTPLSETSTAEAPSTRTAQTPPPGIATETYRCHFDPALGYVTRTTVLGPDGAVIAETVFNEAAATQDGRRVPLRAVTTIAAGAAFDRAQVGGSMAEARFPRPVQTAVTTFQWSEEHHLRLPLRREVLNDQGEQVCLMEFSDYRFLPEESQL